MGRQELTVGLLLSRSGSYEAVSNAMLAGATLAIDEINEDPNAAVSIQSVPVDPAGQLSGYVEGARHLLQDHRLERNRPIPTTCQPC